LKNPSQKRAGGVAQDEGPEFKSHYRKKKKKKREREREKERKKKKCKAAWWLPEVRDGGECDYKRQREGPYQVGTV
jgi:hypothetical protein